MHRIAGTLALAGCVGSLGGSKTEPSGDTGTVVGIDTGELPTTETGVTTQPEALLGELGIGTDLCAFEANPTGTATTAPLTTVPTGYVIEYPGLPACLDGDFAVWAFRYEYGGTPGSDFSATARAYTGSEGAFVLPGQQLDLLTGSDDCGVTVIEGATGLVYSEDFDYLDAGDVTVLTPTGEFALDGSPFYSVYLNYLGEYPSFGSPYGFDVAGSSEVAPIALADAITLPADLTLTGPVFAGVVPRSDTTFTWSGSTGVGEVELRISAQLSGTSPPWYDVTCTLADDGEFLVSGAVLGLLPPGGDAYVYLTRRDEHWYGTTHGRSFRAVGATTTSVTGLIVEP